MLTFCFVFVDTIGNVVVVVVVVVMKSLLLALLMNELSLFTRKLFACFISSRSVGIV